MTTKKPLFTLIGILLSFELIGCMCLSLFSISREELIQKHDYIALIEVRDAFPTEKGADWPMYGVTISTLHQYKGMTQDSLTIGSAHPDFSSVSTSCDILLKKGEQWLIFGTGETRPSSGMCSMIRLRGLDQVSVWGENSVHAMIDSLDISTGKSYHKTKQKGKMISYYPDGSVETISRFKDFELHGKVKRFYPNGKKYRKEKYRNGLQISTEITFEPDGRKREKVRYEDGKKEGLSLFYQKGKIRSKQIFRNGRILNQQHFSHKGVLEVEIIYGISPRSQEIFEYEDGILTRRTLRSQNNYETWQYDKEGNIISHKIDEG